VSDAGGLGPRLARVQKPGRRSSAVALRAMLADALACWMTGAIAGVFIG